MGGDWSWYGYTLDCRRWQKNWHEIFRWHVVLAVTLTLARLLRVPVFIKLDVSEARHDDWNELAKTDTEPMPNAFENQRLVQAARKRLNGSRDYTQ